MKTQFNKNLNTPARIKKKLEHLRTRLRSGAISQGELCILTSLASHIKAGDVELLEAAGVSEFEATGYGEK